MVYAVNMKNASMAIRIDPQVKALLIERMKPQESFNDTLRRLLKVGKKGVK